MTGSATANSEFTSLTTGVDFSTAIADVSSTPYQVPAGSGPLYEAVSRITDAELTSGKVGGSGTFDQLMLGFKAHLAGEYEKGRISGAEYTKAFIALTEGAMSNSVQFLLGKETAYWQSINAQMQARILEVQLVTARVDLETAKARLRQTRLEAEVARANYALTKAEIANKSIEFDKSTFELGQLLPQQLNLLIKQVAGTQADNDTKTYTLNNILPAQKTLALEQAETQRSQTLDTRTDGTVVAGSVGKQKALYTQQITSYKVDGQIKAAKIFADAWITQKSMDEGTLPPSGFANASLDTVLSALKDANDLN